MRLVRPIARRDKVRIHALMPRDVPSVFMDPRALEQILVNILNNAISHSPSSGWIELETMVEGSKITVAISDEGTGIPAADLDYVFEPFYQSGDPDLSRPNGTGLGLSIVKELVEQSAGSVSIESGLGKGTRVSLALPRVQ